MSLWTYSNLKKFKFIDISQLYVAAAAAKLLQSCLTLCNPIDGSPPGSAVHGILQARTLEWVAISFSNAWKWKVKVKSLSRVRLFFFFFKFYFIFKLYINVLDLPNIKMNPPQVYLCSCSTLNDPMDCSPPGSSVHGIFQARVLEWGAIAFSATLC